MPIIQRVWTCTKGHGKGKPIKIVLSKKMQKLFEEIWGKPNQPKR